MSHKGPLRLPKILGVGKAPLQRGTAWVFTSAVGTPHKCRRACQVYETSKYRNFRTDGVRVGFNFSLNTGLQHTKRQVTGRQLTTHDLADTWDLLLPLDCLPFQIGTPSSSAGLRISLAVLSELPLEPLDDFPEFSSEFVLLDGFEEGGGDLLL